MCPAHSLAPAGTRLGLQGGTVFAFAELKRWHGARASVSVTAGDSQKRCSEDGQTNRRSGGRERAGCPGHWCQEMGSTWQDVIGHQISGKGAAMAVSRLLGKSP